MLQAVRDVGSSPDFRSEFSARLTLTGLPANVRSDSQRSDLWRDYQQLLKEWSFVHSDGERFRLSAVGELALQGSIEEALALAVFRFQYPNGYKLRYPKWSRTTPPEPREGNDWSQYLHANGVQIRPAVVIARLLLVQSDVRQIERITADDIQSRLFRIIREPASDEELLDSFFQPPDRDWAPHTKRNASEWLRAIAATGLFRRESDSGAVSLERSKRDLLTQVMQVVAAEPRWIPPAGDNAPPDEIGRDWFGHSQGLRGAAQDRIAAKASGESAGRVGVARIELRPHARRHRYLLSERVAPAGFDSVAAEVQRQAAEQLHDDILCSLASWLRAKGYEPQEDPNSIDLLVCAGQYVEIFEVKTIERANWAERVRLAIGQVLEYQSRFHYERGVLAKTTIVLSRRIPIEGWIASHLERLGINLLVMNGTEFEPIVR